MSTCSIFKFLEIDYSVSPDIILYCLNYCTSAGSSAIVVGVSTVLSSAAAITTIFGVGGAGKLH